MYLFVLTGEKPFPCPHCSAAFRNPNSLKQHLPVHTGVKPHRCRHCGKGFALSSKLARHVKKHDSDMPYITKPYSCRLCPSAFAQSATLATHLRKKHGSLAAEMRAILDPGLTVQPPVGENVTCPAGSADSNAPTYYQEHPTGIDPLMSAFLSPSGQLL